MDNRPAASCCYTCLCQFFSAAAARRRAALLAGPVCARSIHQSTTTLPQFRTFSNPIQCRITARMNEQMNVAADAATTGFIAAIIFVMIVIKHAFLLVLAESRVLQRMQGPATRQRLPDGIIHFSSTNLKNAGQGEK